MSVSVDQSEVDKFAKLADDWWNPQGELKTLHEINVPRLEFIITKIKDHFHAKDTKLPLKKLRILDIGCGGGILSEPLARLGGEITAIDASKESINVAKLHAKQTGLNVDYFCETVEKHIKKNTKYDVVTCLEVLEHVDNVEEFIANCSKLVKRGGLIFFSTINKTLKSYMQAIVAAEYIMRWLPAGTHNWEKFLRPSTINNVFMSVGVELKEIKGIGLNWFGLQRWVLTNKIDVNYILYGKK